MNLLILLFFLCLFLYPYHLPAEIFISEDYLFYNFFPFIYFIFSIFFFTHDVYPHPRHLVAQQIESHLAFG